MSDICKNLWKKVCNPPEYDKKQNVVRRAYILAWRKTCVAFKLLGEDESDYVFDNRELMVLFFGIFVAAFVAICLGFAIIGCIFVACFVSVLSIATIIAGSVLVLAGAATLLLVGIGFILIIPGGLMIFAGFFGLFVAIMIIIFLIYPVFLMLVCFWAICWGIIAICTLIKRCCCCCCCNMQVDTEVKEIEMDDLQCTV